MSSNVCSNRSRYHFLKSRHGPLFAGDCPHVADTRLARPRTPIRRGGYAHRNAPVRRSRWNTGDERGRQGDERRRAGRRVRKPARLAARDPEPAARRRPARRRTAAGERRPNAAPRATARAARRSPRPRPRRRAGRRGRRRDDGAEAGREPPSGSSGQRARGRSPGPGSPRPPRRRRSGCGWRAERSRPCADDRRAAVIARATSGVFWERAYRENITGLAGDGRLQPGAGAVPVRAAGPLHLRPGDREPRRSRRACSATCRASSPPPSRDSLTSVVDRIREQLDHDRRRRRARRDLDRRLVLGRDGHRLLSHLPRRVPRLGRAEALRARDARRRDRCSSPPASSSRSPRGCSPRAPTTSRSGSIRSDALRAVVVLLAALLITFAICSLIYYVVPKGHVPWRGVWPGALFVTADDRDRATRSSRSISTQSERRSSSAARSASSSSR